MRPRAPASQGQAGPLRRSPRGLGTDAGKGLSQPPPGSRLLAEPPGSCPVLRGALGLTLAAGHLLEQ